MLAQASWREMKVEQVKTTAKKSARIFLHICGFKNKTAHEKCVDLSCLVKSEVGKLASDFV
jgi:hypothetical protein